MNLHGTYADIIEIGSGGGGTVFKAYHIRMKKWVILKKIHDNIKDGVDIRGELDILKNLRHEYLPSVLDFIEDGSSVYTVMDYIPGESFETLINRGVHFEPAKVIKYAAQLGQVLVYLHGQNPPVIHGDIKPANIMLTPEDNICLIDFNISQLRSGCLSRNMGYTPGYASPEQTEIVKKLQQCLAESIFGSELSKTEVMTPKEFEDQTDTMLLQGGVLQEGTLLLDSNLNQKKEPRTIRQKNLYPKMDERSDIYSVGATLYAFLTGQAPSSDFAAIVPVERLVENCQEGLAYLIEKSMQLRPEKRFQSAAGFVRAVVDIAKVNKRYRHLVLRQNLAAVGCIVGMAGCAILAILGKEWIREEQVAAYHMLVEEMEELCAASGKTNGNLEELYNEAVGLFPEYAEAYYQKAVNLYERRDYEELVNFISEEVLSHVSSFSDEEIAGFYFLLANSYLDMDRTDDALMYYRNAIKYNSQDNTYYHNYAIALARVGKLEEAGTILENAEGVGVSADKVLLAKAEIAAKQGNREDAAEHFSQCIAMTDNSYIKLCAYVGWGKLYDENPSEEGLLEETSILTEGLTEVADSDKPVILEQLAQAYINLGDMTGGSNFRWKAIDCLNEIVKCGWDNYITHTNIGILYQTIGEYEAAVQEYADMLILYGEDYRTYKRLAILEIDIQKNKEISEREYSQFVDYYDKARQLFADSKVQRDPDLEIQLLENVYKQLEDGNWLN